MTTATLFGINDSNKDFSVKDSWGKNIFNNAFPIALLCYMSSKGINPVYIMMKKNGEIHRDMHLRVTTLFKINPLSSTIRYNFEDKFDDFYYLARNEMPGIDLVISENRSGIYEDVSAFEIKLTTLPDNTTCHLPESKYGSELVVRPDTIVYQAYTIAHELSDKKEYLKGKLNSIYNSIDDWKDITKVLSVFNDIVGTFKDIFSDNISNQKPILIQPVWKTLGKSAILTEKCLDVFIWSSFSLSKLYFEKAQSTTRKIGRKKRTSIWLFLMLHEFSNYGTIGHRRIIDEYTYDNKNDKAFSISGVQTRKLMEFPEMINLRIGKDEIKNIILNGGQNLLSPERRFDGVIQSDVSLFD